MSGESGQVGGNGRGAAGTRRRPLARLAVYGALVVLSVLYALPLVWMVSTSVKPEDQAISQPPTFIPRPVDQAPRYAAENYSEVWTDPSVRFPLYLRNTLWVAALAVTGMVASSAVAAYGFARLRWRGRGFVFALVLATLMVPFPVVMVPLYTVFKSLGWIGTFKPLWVPAWLGFGGGLSIFLLRQFYMTIPRELDEAARIDGCGQWGIFTRIILPLSRPALAVVALFYFNFVWNDFLTPYIFLNHQDQFTLALGLQLYQSQAGNTPWNLLMAASTLVVAPVLLLFLIAQRTFVQGVATEGLKG